MQHRHVQKGNLQPGRAYALRNRSEPELEEPFIKVTYLGTTHRDQARVKFETGKLAGLEEWVRTRHLACAWGNRKALSRDEERSARLRAVDAELWDPVYEEAVNAVMTASGEYTGFLRRWSTDSGSATRFWKRGGLDGSPLDDHAANFVDRNGEWQLSFETAIKACRAFAGAEPELVDLYLTDWEKRLTAEGWEPGNQHAHELLRKWAPSHALARSWSQEPRGSAAEQEIERLRKLVASAVHSLRTRGHESEAIRIERGLHGG